MKQTLQKAWRNTHIAQTLKALNLERKEYKRFLIVGNKIQRRLEYYCNGYMGNEPQYIGNKLINKFDDEEYERYIVPLMDVAKEMAKEKGLYIFFQTDPRGGTIYLDKKPIPYNNYTQAYCIY